MSCYKLICCQAAKRVLIIATVSGLVQDRIMAIIFSYNIKEGLLRSQHIVGTQNEWLQINSCPSSKTSTYRCNCGSQWISSGQAHGCYSFRITERKANYTFSIFCSGNGLVMQIVRLTTESNSLPLYPPSQVQQVHREHSILEHP